MTAPFYNTSHGLALLNKPIGKTSFYLISFLRKLTGERCIGHAGTLDPFATGVMILLIGKPYTRQSARFIEEDKEYTAKLKLGATTDTFDCEGVITSESSLIPTLFDIQETAKQFQGTITQLPPMYSAKKVNGQKLYELARLGKTVERATKKVNVELTILNYAYPYLDIHVKCSSGTYIRSIADDMGRILGCGAHLVELTRTRIGSFLLKDCQNCQDLTDKKDLVSHR